MQQVGKRPPAEPVDGPPAKRSKERRLRFGEPSTILFDADLPVVSRYGGCRLPTSPTARARHEASERDVRELNSSVPLDEIYAAETRSAIFHAGLGITSTCGCNDIPSLQAQLDLVQDLRLEAMIAFGDHSPTADESADPRCFQGKELLGHRGSGYVFGHRFLTLEQYINTMEDMELAAFLKDAGRPVPAFRMLTREEKGGRIDPAELVSIHYFNQRKPLDALNMEELQLECTIRGLFELASRKRLKKKVLLKALRPIFIEEHHVRTAEMRQRTAMETAVTDLLLDACEAKLRECLRDAMLKRLNEPVAEEVAATPEVLSALFKRVVAKAVPTAHTACPVPVPMVAAPGALTGATQESEVVATPSRDNCGVNTVAPDTVASRDGEAAMSHSTDESDVADKVDDAMPETQAPDEVQTHAVAA
ncbi:hypothetical protein ACHHYP_13420 [Achlya hypogyna]|uniref:Uncharacterized protein n=1 Tax=Achlya hypogyna TaxID=1202772 RepID=A0A1V9YFC2_ACHHY|nr:hypothetical protein ACHHYP_13420 [Achlya hypogyna]